jgi:hypothetical protein
MSVQQISNLFYTVHSSAAWNVTLLNKLCSELYQQLEDVRICLMPVMGEEESVSTIENPTLNLKEVLPGNLPLS